MKTNLILLAITLVIGFIAYFFKLQCDDLKKSNELYKNNCNVLIKKNRSLIDVVEKSEQSRAEMEELAKSDSVNNKFEWDIVIPANSDLLIRMHQD